MKKRALGIFIDDYQLKAALLVANGKQAEVETLETFQLVEQLEDRESLEAKKDEKSITIEDQGFGLDIENSGLIDTDKELPADGKTNIDIIIDIINRMIPKGTRVGFNLSNSFTLYKNITDIQETNKKKLKKAIWSDFYESNNGDTKFENVGFLKRTDGSLLSVVHDDPLVLSALFDEACTITRSNPVRLSLVDTIEFTLAHELTQNYDFDKDSNSAVIIFADGFTKIFFMQGNEIKSVLPTIHEGADSETVCDTAFSKILFELDSGNISSLNNIILVGENARLESDVYFKKRLPELKIIRFDAARAANGINMDKYDSQMESYSIAIALALKMLDEKNTVPYNQNFLPSRIRDKTSIYKISWHGLLLLIILFLSAFFVTTKSISNNIQIKKAGIKSAFLDNELVNLKSVAHQVDSLRNEINELKKSTALIDSMTKETIRWTPTLEKFSNAFKEIGPFSITKINTPFPGHMIVELKMKNREQVAKLERFMDFSLISAVYTAEEDREFINVTLDCQVKINQVETKDSY